MAVPGRFLKKSRSTGEAPVNLSLWDPPLANQPSACPSEGAFVREDKIALGCELSPAVIDLLSVYFCLNPKVIFIFLPG